MQGQYLSFTALGAALQPLLDRSRDGCVLHRQHRAQDARKRGRRAHRWSRGTSSTIAPSSRRGRPGSTSVPCTLRGSCPTPEHDRWRSWFERACPAGLPAQDRRNRSRRRDAGSRVDSGSRQADAARDVRIRLRGRRQRRADRAPEHRRFHASFLGSSSGDEGAGFVETRDRRSAATSAAKRC